MIKAPEFWWRPPGWRSNLLSPLGRLYGGVTARRMARRGERSSLPVLCVGNFVVGGAGKTPFAIELARRLAALDERPAFLTRGHGGSLAGPVLVAPHHQASEVGDEALLLAGHAETVVARSRIAGARLAEATGASAIIMDDGLQNPTLAKDLSFAVVDAETGVGNGLCLPAGPLRAPLASQWEHVHALVLMKGDMAGAASDHDGGGPAAPLIREAGRRGLPVIEASIVAEAASAEALSGRKVVAFAGIGRPGKFFASLRAAGAVIVGAREFADHHRFRPRELEALADEARQNGAVLVTTEKDMMRLSNAVEMGAGPARLSGGIPLHVLKVAVRIEDNDRLDSQILGALAAKRRG